MTISQSALLKNFKLYFEILFENALNSLKSSKFYYDVLKNYTGFGIKYLSFFVYWSSFIIVLSSYIWTYNLKEFLESPGSAPYNNASRMINKILDDWYPVEFDGYEIRSKMDDPKMIKSSTGEKLILIDTESKLPASKYLDYFIVLTKKSIIFNFEIANENHNFSQEYKNIYKIDSNITIDKERLRKIIIDFIDNFKSIIIFAFLPILFIINLVNIIISNLLSLIIFYLISRFLLNINLPFKNLFRGIIFSVSVASSFSILGVLFPTLYTISFIIQIYTIFLLAMGIRQLKESHR